MRPQCNVGELRIEGPGRREVLARFDGGRMSSDGGAVLLRRRYGIGPLAGCGDGAPALRDAGVRMHLDPPHIKKKSLYNSALGMTCHREYR